MQKVVIIGGGAAGMMAGIKLAEKGYAPVIYEKNEKLGKKLFITGKGRCNLTNNCSVEDLLSNTVSNHKFMFSAYYGFSSYDTMDLFESLGLEIKTERGNRVFPTSDHSSDVIKVLINRLKELNVPVFLNTSVKEIIYKDFDDVEEDNEKKKRLHQVKAVRIKNASGKEEMIDTDNVVIATGGKSYPQTGSTGDGYEFVKNIGVTVNEPHPALVPMVCKEALCKELMGLTLKNVKLSMLAKVKNKDKVVYSEQGEFLFTHFGASGPLVLSASSYVHKYLDSDLRISLDFKPALSEEQLDARIMRDFSQNLNKQFQNALDDLLPKRVIPYVIEQSGIDPYKRVNSIEKAEREQLVKTLKNFILHVYAFRGFEEAIITQGGISVKDIDPQTMAVKRVKGLYCIGEVLDVDAVTGGFNLQIAWSTAAAIDIKNEG